MRALLQAAAAATLLMLAGGSAMAADVSLAPVDEMAPPAPPIWSWTGASIGLQAGYAWSTSHVSEIVSGFGDGSFRADLKTHNAMLGLSAKF